MVLPVPFVDTLLMLLYTTLVKKRFFTHITGVQTIPTVHAKMLFKTSGIAVRLRTHITRKWTMSSMYYEKSFHTRRICGGVWFLVIRKHNY